MLKKVILLTIVVTFLLSLFPLSHKGMGDGSPTTTLSVEPPGTFGLSPGDTFSINITVSNVTDLRSWQFQLYYLNAVLNATSYAEGPFLKTPEVYTFFFAINFTDNYNATHGLIFLTAGRYKPGVNVTGVSGTGSIATITFKAKAGGGSILHFANTELIDSAKPPNDIPHTLIDGQAYVGLVDIAVTKIDTPTNIPQGSVAYVNVTTQNKGQFAETFDVTLSEEGNPIETKTVLNLPGGQSQILNYTWNTALLPIGEYNLTATATTVPGDDPSDNTLSLKVHIGTRDLAITNLAALKKVVCQGFWTPMNVTVENQGVVSETSNITVYANQTIIATFENITLTSGNFTTFAFTFNTTAYSTKGNCTISAYVWPVPYEMNTDNNNLTGWVIVSIVGDITGPTGWPDGACDIRDVATVSRLYGADSHDPRYNPNYDIVYDENIDIRDVALVSRNYGMIDP